MIAENLSTEPVVAGTGVRVGLIRDTGVDSSAWVGLLARGPEVNWPLACLRYADARSRCRLLVPELAQHGGNIKGTSE